MTTERPDEGAVRPAGSLEQEAGRAKDGPRSRSNVQELHSWIRSAILNGSIGAGETINQARLAAQLGVSRTPLREALRMLQAEGLIVGKLNYKMQVSAPDAADIDSLYSARILLECMGVAVTVPRLSAADIERIRHAFKHMNAHGWTGDRSAWEVHHNAFHALLVMHVATCYGQILAETIADLRLRAERTRRISLGEDPTAARLASEDHALIFEAVAAKDADRAVSLLARHLARTAINVVRRSDPSFAPVAVEQAMANVSRNSLGATFGLLPGEAATPAGATPPAAREP